MFYINHPDFGKNVVKERKFWKTMAILYHGSYLHTQSNKKKNLVKSLIDDTDVDIIGQTNLQDDVVKKWGRSAQFRCYLPLSTSRHSKMDALRHVTKMYFGYTDRNRKEIEEIKYSKISYSDMNFCWYFAVSSYDLMVFLYNIGFRPGIVKENSEAYISIPNEYEPDWIDGSLIVNFSNFRPKPEKFMFKKIVVDDEENA